MKKVVLAFSGGLDTSFSIPYLMEQGYQVVTVTVDTGGFSSKELKAIAHKSKTLGAVKHYQIDGTKMMYEDIVSYIIKTNGLYQGSYPNMCADRYIIAEKVLEIAAKEKCNTVAHGSTAMGNDQVRFDIATMTLSPKTVIVSPIKEVGGNRDEEQQFLKDKGFDIPPIHQKYSVNQNMLGVTYSGSEIDMVEEPDESMFLWTKQIKSKPSYIDITFANGLPVTLDGKKLGGSTILKKLNQLAGAYGYGKAYYTGDCMIGIKGHITFEAPGILTLIEAHKALEQLVLTKHQQSIGHELSQHFTDLLYSGKFYEPTVKNLKAFFNSQQQSLSGSVKIKLIPNQILPVEVKSPFSLIQPGIATYAQGCSWTPQDADGFIKLFGLQGKISALVNKKQLIGGELNV